jgi:hypothetical protein
MFGFSGKYGKNSTVEAIAQKALLADAGGRVEPLAGCTTNRRADRERPAVRYEHGKINQERATGKLHI